MEYAHAKMAAKRTARAIARAKKRKPKPDQFKLGFIAAVNVLNQENGRGKLEVEKIAARYRKDVGAKR